MLHKRKPTHCTEHIHVTVMWEFAVTRIGHNVVRLCCRHQCVDVLSDVEWPHFAGLCQDRHWALLQGADDEFVESNFRLNWEDHLANRIIVWSVQLLSLCSYCALFRHIPCRFDSGMLPTALTSKCSNAWHPPFYSRIPIKKYLFVLKTCSPVHPPGTCLWQPVVTTKWSRLVFDSQLLRLYSELHEFVDALCEERHIEWPRA